VAWWIAENQLIGAPENIAGCLIGRAADHHLIHALIEQSALASPRLQCRH
jgi:hypothetical protein